MKKRSTLPRRWSWRDTVVPVDLETRTLIRDRIAEAYETFGEP